MTSFNKNLLIKKKKKKKNLAIFIVASTLIPFIIHDFWIFRVFEYPRLQKLVLNVIIVISMMIIAFPADLVSLLTITALTGNLIYLSYLIFPYTPFSKKQIITSKNTDEKKSLKILIANVYQENRKSQAYHELVDKYRPDILLMVETNSWWEEAMNGVVSIYPYRISVPLENTYGMMLYSRLPIEGEVRFLVEKDIPSIEAELTLPGGQRIKIYCLHPQPPVPQENPRSTERDREILMVAKKAKDANLPVIVMGDLNDVAWSYTTDLFGKISGLVDPRRGRGFYNSFNAKYFFSAFRSTTYSVRRIFRLVPSKDLIAVDRIISRCLWS